MQFQGAILMIFNLFYGNIYEYLIAENAKFVRISCDGFILNRMLFCITVSSNMV